jgi:CheY-like chemotaxis protein
MWHHSNKSNKNIKFTDDSLKCCICFIEFENVVNNFAISYESSQIREYYSIVINSLTPIIKINKGKVVKSLGDRLLCYFLNFSDINNEKAFEEVIECGFEIIDKRDNINKELLMKNNLPPLEYFKISIDYGVVDLALAGDNYQLDVFGSTVNVCSKINSSPSLSSKNEIIIGNNFYRVLKSFSNLINKYNFLSSGEFQITENIGYPTYIIKRKDTSSSLHNGVSNSIYALKKDTNLSYKDSIENKIFKKRLFFHKKNNKSKRIIIVDDDQEIVFTYKLFLENYDYHLISFIDPLAALDYIKNLSNFDDLLVILDIRMQNLNGFQLHQQIKAIDPTIKIIFVTVLDIADELLTIVPGLSKEQIMRKPVNKKEFTNTVKNILN